MNEEDEQQSCECLSQGHMAAPDGTWISLLSAFPSALGVSPVKTSS